MRNLEEFIATPKSYLLKVIILDNYSFQNPNCLFLLFSYCHPLHSIFSILLFGFPLPTDFCIKFIVNVMLERNWMVTEKITPD